MKSKNDIIWIICMLYISAATIVLAGPKGIRESLPEIVVRIIGTVDLIALFVLVITTIRKAKKK